MADDDRIISMTAGKPHSQDIRAPGVKLIWPELSQIEIRAQLRLGKTTEDVLVSNLHNFMTNKEFVNNDLVIHWLMTGADTRAIRELQGRAKAYFSIIISDNGPTDAKALVTPLITTMIADTTTTAAGDL